jgi:beta-galactosidase GanA
MKNLVFFLILSGALCAMPSLTHSVAFRIASRWGRGVVIIGYFVDNELTGGGSCSDRERYAIALTVLGLNADSPAKKAFINQLRKSYTDIAALNARWRTNLANWGTLQQPLFPESQQEAAMKDDLAAFMKAFASQYYRTVRNTVKAHDPNHPYRGMFGSGMVAVANQSQRAAAYERYVRSAAEHPAFVGTHWFQYLDEPLTARAFDRENHNVGFVNVTDNPYPELVTAARRANAAVLAQRYK